MDIKILVACHKPSYVPENPFLYPIQVGAALSDKRLEGMLYDDEGDSISEKNKSYCELTAQYWAWKNMDAEYYGFFHYRRYLAFDPELKRDDGWGNIAYDRITPGVIQEIRLLPEIMEKMIAGKDVITVKSRRYPRIREEGKKLDVYHEFGTPSFQHRKDLNTALKVLLEKHPEYRQSAKEYMHSSMAYECNMFIMKREEYCRYCEWLFDILFETEKRIDMSSYSVEEYRVMGYLAERMFGIYYTHLKKNTKLQLLELPKTLFKDTDPKAKLEPIFENGIPVVLAANDRFAPYLGVMIQSIVEKSSKNQKYDVIVLNNDITEKNQEMVGFSAKDRENIRIRFADVSRYFDADKLFVDQHLSVETYYRLIIPELMPDYDKILYLDCDMVVERDVAELYQIDLEDYVIAAARDIDVAGNIKLRDDWEPYATQELKLDSPYDYFQAGVLVMGLNALREITSSKEMIKLALSNSWRCQDQDVLNIICKNRVKYLPQRWNVQMNWEEGSRSRMQIMKMAPRALYQEYMEARKNPYIVHFAGYQKPWNIVDCDFSWYFWKYAALSSYYPFLLLQAAGHSQSSGKTSGSSLYDNENLRKVANQMLPIGSRRRELVKKMAKKVVKR